MKRQNLKYLSKAHLPFQISDYNMHFFTFSLLLTVNSRSSSSYIIFSHIYLKIPNLKSPYVHHSIITSLQSFLFINYHFVEDPSLSEGGLSASNTSHSPAPPPIPTLINIILIQYCITWLSYHDFYNRIIF